MTDQVDAKTSFLLSRFVKGHKCFQLDFAVQGAESGGMVNHSALKLCTSSLLKIYFNILIQGK